MKIFGISFVLLCISILLISQAYLNNNWIPKRDIISPLSNNRKICSNRHNIPLYAKDEPGMDGGVRIRSAEWAKKRGMEPGYGGIWPGDPNAKKFKVTIKDPKSGEIYETDVPVDRYIFYYFEEMGIDIPVINKCRMCRQGCCTICTIKVTEGKVKQDAPLGLLKELRNQGYALSCCSYPRSDIVCELQSEDETFVKQWSDYFESGGVEYGGVFLDED